MNIKKLSPGAHVWVKKVAYHQYSPVAHGFEAKGYVIDGELSPRVLYVVYYWSKKNSAVAGKDGVSLFHTSLITEHAGYIIHTLNSDYEIYDLSETTNAPDSLTVLRQFWR